MKKLPLFFLLPLAALLVGAAAGSLASSYTANGTAGAGFLQVANQSVAPSTPTAAGRIYFNSGNDLAWKEAGGFVGVVDLGGVSRTITLSGSPTLGDWFNQSVKSSATPAFAGATIGTNGTAATRIRFGVATLIGGAAVVSDANVTSSTRIVVTSNVDGGAPGWLRVSARTASTSFTITSSSGTDTSTVAYTMWEP